MNKRASLNSVMIATYNHLQELLNLFSAYIVEHAVAFEVYELPIVKIKEAVPEPDEIPITNIHYANESGKDFLRKTYATLKFDATKYSTYLAHRYPGFVVMPFECQKETELFISQINKCKDDFYLSVKQDIKKRQNRHINLHKNIENIVLLTATRHISSSTTPISKINFYWQHKTLQKKLSLEEASQALERSKSNPAFEYSFSHKDDKLELIEKEIERLQHIPQEHELYEIRQIRAQPFVDLWTKPKGSKANKKVSSKNAVLPIIIYGDSAPNTSPLKSYKLSETRQKEIKYPLINARKHWYAIPKN